MVDSTHTLKKHKLLLVITKSNWGGAQRYVYDLATNLPKDQFSVTVALGGEGPLKERLIAAGIPTTSIPGLQRDVSIFKEFTVFFALLKLFRSEKPDIVHLNSSKIGGLGVITAHLLGIPRITFTAHGFAFNEDRSWVSKIILKFLYWFMIAGSSNTILVSRGMGKDIVHWPFIQRKLTVIYNAVPTLTFRERDDARAALAHFSPALGTWMQSNPSGTVLGTIGELHHIKGHRFMIDAVASLPHTAYAIIGGGDDHDALEKYIRARNLSDRVFLLGARPDAYQCLKGFDMFILASLSETFGLVLLEAGQAGLPVVATAVGGVPEIIEHEVTGLLVPSRDSQALATSVQRLCADQPLRERLAHDLNEKSLRDFALPRMIEETIRVYESPKVHLPPTHKSDL